MIIFISRAIWFHLSCIFGPIRLNNYTAAFMVPKIRSSYNPEKKKLGQFVQFSSKSLPPSLNAMLIRVMLPEAAPGRPTLIDGGWGRIWQIQKKNLNLESHIIFFSFHHGEPKNTFNAIDFFKKKAC